MFLNNYGKYAYLSMSALFAASAWAEGINESDIIKPSEVALQHVSDSARTESGVENAKFFATDTDMYVKSGTYGMKVNNSWDGAIQGSVGTSVYVGDYENIGDTSNVFLTPGSTLYELNFDGASGVIYGGDFTNGHVVGRAKTPNASITIYGGKFRDIVGGNWGTGETTGNVDIKMYGGSVSDSKSFGLSGGGMEVQDNLNGNVNILLSSLTKNDGTKTSAESTYVIGGSARGASVSGGVNITLEDQAKTWAIIGGSGDIEYKKNGGTVGSTNIVLDGGIVSSDISIGTLNSPMVSGIVGGGMNKSGVVGDTNITVKGDSQVKAPIIGGNIGVLDSSVGGSSNINIEGGTIDVSGTSSVDVGGQTLSMQNGIYGGSASFGVNYRGFLGWGAVRESGSSVIEGGSNIVVSGGTINGNIYGGGYSNGASGTYTATSQVKGGSKISVDSSSSAVAINGDIYGGGYAENSYSTSNLEGGTNILFKGAGTNLSFEGKVSASGAGAGTANVSGNRVLSFGDSQSAFTGQFNGTINNDKIDGQNQFNELLISSGSSVEFTKEFAINVDALSIFSDSAITGNATINVDDVLNIFVSDAFSGASLTFDLGETVVLSSEASQNIQILHEDGSVFEGADWVYNSDTNSILLTNVPEPAAYAAIFGALALFIGIRRGKRN